MSEYWVSKKKYQCKYCDIFIADDAPSRQQHENGMRHKGNKERFVRSLYKAGEKRKRDEEEEKKEMVRIDRAAQEAYAQDVGAGRAKGAGVPSSVGTSSSSSRKAAPAPKPSNPYTNYSTAQSLGYTDPDAERLAAEATVRQTQGVAGEWQVVVDPIRATTAATEGGPVIEVASTSIARGDEDDTRGFRLGKRRVGGLGEMYDPGMIVVKKKEAEAEATEEAKREESVWKAVKWEEEEPRAPVKQEDAAGGSLFRKRRRK